MLPETRGWSGLISKMRTIRNGAPGDAAITGDLLAIDPGTHSCGFALLLRGKLQVAWTVSAGLGPIEDRLRFIVEKFTYLLATEHPEVMVVACEKAAFLDGRQPAPELQVAIRRLRSIARRLGREFHTYNPSTVAASVRPRGMARGTPRKEVLRLGVRLLYREAIDSFKWETGMPQDSYDAIAVGHCHLAQQFKRRIDASR